MSVVGEAALSALFELLFEQIASSSYKPLKLASEKHVRSEITKWEKMLRQMKAVLEDAEEKQMTNNSVKMWLDDIQDLAYDVEDILDEFATESLKRKLKLRNGASTSKVRKVLHSIPTAINPVAAKFNSTMVSSMKKISTRFQEIVDRKSSLDLIEKVGGRSFDKVCQRPPTSCLQYGRMHGREEDKMKILDLLMDETSNAKFGVIPVVGMGGVGKTTLVQHAYNAEALQQFHLKAWVCVSDEFDILRITKSILESITSKSCDLKELNQVQLELRKALSGKKFLIVLDDIWNKDYQKWEALCLPFMDGAPGSKVIVTTREMEVARMIGRPIECHITLHSISDEDCWLVFIDHAFDGGDVARQNLEAIRVKVINRCDGLPLAARTLGGLLRSKPRTDWENVLNSNIWNLQRTENNVLPVLKLSYYHLPSQLKRCFAYCAIFPKDYEFEMKKLVLLWMAEGLIEQIDDQNHMEDTGEEYFQELLSRSLFQTSSTGRFVMHDLVNDLAQLVAGDTCFRLEDDSKKEKVRHFSYIPGHDRIERFESFPGIKCLRTFMPIPISLSRYIEYYLANKVVSDFLPKLRCLRTLSFRNYNIHGLPDSIGDLKHLRYLDLSCTRIVTLPKTVTSLCNLRTMLLEGCSDLQELPSEMQNLLNLRHLDIKGVNLVRGMPLGIEALKNVHTLSNFIIGKDRREAGITALMNLKFLQGALCISELENVANTSDVRGHILMDKAGIDDLALRWKYNDAPEESLDRGVLEKLKPHGNLKTLTIVNFGGTEFPSWVGDALFHNLTKLTLEYSKNCTTLPQLGLLSSLKNLVIEGFPNVKAIDREFYGGSTSNSNPFPALETLQFQNMYEWEDWNTCGVEFPYLRELSVVRCPKLLRKLPSRLPSLEKLEIEDCLQLVVSFQSLPVISHLKIRGCKEVELNRGCSSPNYMYISQVSFLFPVEEFMQGLKQLQVGDFDFLSQMTYSPAWIFREGLPHIMVENKELFQKGKCGGEIEVLKLQGNCEILEDLFISSTQSDFPSKLRVIRFLDCDALVSLPLFRCSLCLDDLIIYSCQSLISIERHGLPPTLKRLRISNCQKLRSVLNEGEASSSCGANYDFLNLEYLIIVDCGSLTSLGNLPASLKYLEIATFSRPGIPKLESIAASFDNNTSLESIKIRHLPHLEYLPKNMCKLINLHEIQISYCPRLVSFPLGGLPTAHLKTLAVHNCEKLEALPDNMQSLTSLQELAIRYCPGIKSIPEEVSYCPRLVSFPLGRLPTARLKKLEVHNCEKLEALPDNMQSLTSLQELAISDCPGIKSIPEEGFPTNLTSLFLDNVNFCKPLFQWGLHRLTSLKSLRITGGCSEVVSFPQDEIKMKLPASLIRLTIQSFPNLKYLSTKGFQSLTSLEFLCIEECPKLASFPKNGLPPSLLQLHISGCPILERRCQKGKGRESLEIARIPDVRLFIRVSDSEDEE